MLCHYADKSCDHKHCNVGDVFSLPHDLSLTHVYWWKPVTMSHDLAMSDGHWSSASGDIKYLPFHVNLQNHMIQGSSNVMSGSSSWYITNLPQVW